MEQKEDYSKGMTGFDAEQAKLNVSIETKKDAEKKSIAKKANRITTLLVLLAVCTGIIVMLVRPALTGYTISKQFDEMNVPVSDILNRIDDLKAQSLLADANLSSCMSTNEDLLQMLTSEKNATFDCMRQNNLLTLELQSMEKEYDNNITSMEDEYELNRAEIQAELDAEKDKCSKFEEQYTPIIKNAANNICCKAKVDDKNIDSYIISNNRIVCTIGEENEISC